VTGPAAGIVGQISPGAGAAVAETGDSAASLIDGLPLVAPPEPG
jgi:hypothetical protein